MSGRRAARLDKLEAQRWPRRVRVVWWDRRQARPVIAAVPGEQVCLVSWLRREPSAPRSLP